MFFFCAGQIWAQTKSGDTIPWSHLQLLTDDVPQRLSESTQHCISFCSDHVTVGGMFHCKLLEAPAAVKTVQALWYWAIEPSGLLTFSTGCCCDSAAPEWNIMGAHDESVAAPQPIRTTVTHPISISHTNLQRSCFFFWSLTSR